MTTTKTQANISLRKKKERKWKERKKDYADDLVSDGQNEDERVYFRMLATNAAEEEQIKQSSSKCLYEQIV